MVVSIIPDWHIIAGLSARLDEQSLITGCAIHALVSVTTTWYGGYGHAYGHRLVSA